MSLKQRLIGATVLIALAVIFVPMFLDGAGHRERTAVKMDIPPEPEFEFEKRLPPLSDIRSESFESVGSKESVTSKAEYPVLPPEMVKTHVPDDPKLGDNIANERNKSSSPPPMPKREYKAEAKLEPPSRSIEQGWVVQVGSFKLRSNAVALRDKLKAAGYQVIEEKGGTRSIPIYRVKVGPVEKRERATVLLAKLRREQKLEGYVAHFP